jgi:formylglycine-generating enzyme required for sulfatase activity
VAGVVLLFVLVGIFGNTGGNGGSDDSPWLAAYQTTLSEAEGYFAAQDYAQAKTGYEQALSLIPSNDASGKKEMVTQKIADCDRALKNAEAGRLAKERKEKEERDRLACEQAEAAKYDIPLVYVAGGTFTTGCTSEQGSDCDDDEKPAHQVTLSGFYIGRYEATQAQWKVVMGSNPSSFKGDNLPVENVSWDDVQEFIRRLNQKTGRQYRLPAEAEWEYAARGGAQSRGYKYSGSHTASEEAWFGDNSGRKTHPAGQKKANELGLYDMSGNVYEWCSDWMGAYSNSSQTNPRGASSEGHNVFLFKINTDFGDVLKNVRDVPDIYRTFKLRLMTKASLQQACRLKPPVSASMSSTSPAKYRFGTSFDSIVLKSTSFKSTPPAVTNSSL